jgi:hypothetical protein
MVILNQETTQSLTLGNHFDHNDSALAAILPQLTLPQLETLTINPCADPGTRNGRVLALDQRPTGPLRSRFPSSGLPR